MTVHSARLWMRASLVLLMVLLSMRLAVRTRAAVRLNRLSRIRRMALAQTFQFVETVVVEVALPGVELLVVTTLMMVTVTTIVLVVANQMTTTLHKRKKKRKTARRMPSLRRQSRSRWRPTSVREAVEIRYLPFNQRRQVPGGQLRMRRP